MPPRRRRRRRISRKLLMWIGGGAASVILLPILVLIGLVLTIDPNSYKEQLEGSLRQVLGRDLRIRGQLSVSASLSPKLEADDVTLINMPSGSRADMVRIERMTIELATKALLTGRLVISRIALQKPDILIETDAKGAGNWRYKPPIPDAGAADAPNLALVTVHVRDGRLTWRDGPTGAATTVELRRLSMTAASVDAPVVISAELLYGKQRVNIAAQTGPYARFFDASAKSPWGLFANFESGGAKLTLAGALTKPNEFKGYSLRVDATAVDLGNLGWLIPWRLPPLHNFSLSARILDTGGEIPDISGLVIQSGFTNLDKVAAGLSVDTLRLEMARLSEPVSINIEGTYSSAPLRLAGTIGAPALLLVNGPVGVGYNVDLRFEAAGATIAARGTIAEPTLGKGMDIALGARIPDLGLLAPLVGTRLPIIRTIAFAGQLVDGEGGYRNETALRNIVLTAPQGDLAGTIGLAFRERPRLRASLKSVLLDTDAILAAWDASKPPEDSNQRRLPGTRSADVIKPPPLPRRGETIIPDDRLQLDILQAADIDLRATIDLLRVAKIPYRDVAASLVLSDGRLVINPLAAEIGGGRAELRLAIGSRQAAAPVAFAVKASGVDIKPILPAWGIPDLLSGKLDGEAELQATGGSWHELAASLAGRVNLTLSDGELDTRQAGGLALDVLRNIRSGNDRVEGGRTRMRCAVLALDLAAGVATISQAGLDSTRLLGTASGRVNLKDETMALQLRPFLRLAQSATVQSITPVPLRLDTAWQDPKLTPDPTAAGAIPADACGAPPAGAARRPQ